MPTPLKPGSPQPREDEVNGYRTRPGMERLLSNESSEVNGCDEHF